MKNQLITSGYPRSGNTFLAYALKAIYYPNEPLNQRYHTLFTIEKEEKTIVPFREPADCIASWKNHREGDDIILDLKFYIRFYNGVLENLNKVILMDFNRFTVDTEYIKSRIKTKLGFNPVANPTIDEIKVSMKDLHRNKNLPQDNQSVLDLLKAEASSSELFSECLEIYTKLKDAESASL